MRFSSIWHYFFGLNQYETDIINKQKRNRHILHEQIRKTEDIQKILKYNKSVSFSNKIEEIKQIGQNGTAPHLIPIKEEKDNNNNAEKKNDIDKVKNYIVKSNKLKELEIQKGLMIPYKKRKRH
jgi:hypothetical protein